METRYTNNSCAIEKRDDSEYLEGYAAVFYREGESSTEFKMWEGVTERIKSTAFDRLKASDYDLTGDFNHDPSYILGRRSAGTMSITIDDVGLFYSVRLADNPIHQFVRDAVQRGDVSGASFVFQNASPAEWTQHGDNGEISRRWLVDVHVRSLGPVVNPAYLATTAGVRSFDEAQAEFKRWNAERSDCDNYEHDRVTVMNTIAGLGGI